MSRGRFSQEKLEAIRRLSEDRLQQAAVSISVDELGLNALAAHVISDLKRISKNSRNIDREIPDQLSDWAGYGPYLPALFPLFDLPALSMTSYLHSKKSDRIKILEVFVDELVKRQY
jgi:hypothetical protein